MALLVTADGGLAAVVDVARREREDSEASQEDVASREAAASQDLCCYVSLLGVDDEETTLGLGLFVHPRTVAQRRKGLAPDLDLVFDYLDVASFNRGVRERPWMVSSARSELNGWLPLYVNAEHWARARRYVASAFAVLLGEPGEGPTEAALRPARVLDACCSLLTCAIVGFTRGQTWDASPRTAGRGVASEKAVQMYADVHRLLLQLAAEQQEVRAVARRRVEGFLSDPACRTRDRTPSIAGLVHCLLLLDDVEWEDLAPQLIPEALRRHVMRQECKDQEFRPDKCGGSVEKIIAAWDNFAPQAGIVVSFSVILCRRLGKWRNSSLEDVKAAYDRRWGRLRQEVVTEILQTCAELRSKDSVLDILAPVLPAGCGEERLAELILWAAKHGSSWELGVPSWWAERRQPWVTIPEEQWPSLAGPTPLLQQLRRAEARRRSVRWPRSALEPPQHSTPLKPPQQRRWVPVLRSNSGRQQLRQPEEQQQERQAPQRSWVPVQQLLQDQQQQLHVQLQAQSHPQQLQLQLPPPRPEQLQVQGWTAHPTQASPTLLLWYDLPPQGLSMWQAEVPYYATWDDAYWFQAPAGAALHGYMQHY